MTEDTNSHCPPASLIKQLAAMIYDSLLLFALLFFATAIALVFNHGEAIAPNPWFSIYLLLTVFTFYAWFWHKSGQTLGMRAWKIRIVEETGGNPGWGRSYLRLCCALLSIACLGLGYWWRLFKPWTWHDRLSGTQILDVSARAKARAETDADTVR